MSVHEGQHARRGPRLVAAFHSVGDGAADHLVPQPTPRRVIRDHGFDSVTKSFGETRNLPQAAGQHLFDTGAQFTRQRRRSATARNRHGYGIAVDDGGRNECGEFGVVDDIDGHTCAPRRLRHRRIDRQESGGRNNNGTIGDIERFEQAALVPDAPVGRPGSNFPTNVRGDNDNPRTSGGQESQLCRRARSAADNQHLALTHSEKNRKVPHAAFILPKRPTCQRLISHRRYVS